MTLEHARVIRAEDATHVRHATGTAIEETRARRIAHEIEAARVEAARIVAAAREQARMIGETAAADAAREAREREVARLAASFVALRDADARRTERDADRLVELAVLLAERLLGESLRLEPQRIAELATIALTETRGARRVRIDAAPDDADTLRETLGALGQTTEVRPDPALGRGSLVVHTDLGRIDARLETQLAALGAALREALR